MGYSRYRTTIPNSGSNRKTPKRAYNSPTRRQKADDTRVRIVRAAHDLFFEKGYAATTLKEIADRAGVSEPTIYAVFSSKRQLLLAVFHAARKGAAQARVEAERIGSAPLDSPPTAASIARSVRTTREGGAPVARIIQAAGDADPELGRLWEEIQDERHDRMREVAESLSSAELLRQDLTLDEATDILWLLTSNDNYVHLVLERGWTPERYEAWLEGVLASSLMRDDGGRRTPRNASPSGLGGRRSP